jgi:hypothetical protein
MISFFEAKLSALSIHRIGNKCQDESYVLSDEPTKVGEDQDIWLLNYFFMPFYKVNERYSLYHPSGNVGTNEVYYWADRIFAEQKDFHDSSRELAKLLYEVSNHPKVKSGELYVALFKDVQLDGELHQALGIFKSDTKESYMHINPVVGGFNLDFSHNAINLQSPDKGCLIFNTDKEAGYKVVILQEKEKSASYWKHEFLRVEVINNAYNQTNNAIGVIQHFIKDKLDEEFEMSYAEKADLLNKSVKYLKEKEQFDLEEFTQEVFAKDTAIQLFKDYKTKYEEEYDLTIPERFNISAASVRKSQGRFKSLIKLDNNFHLQINGHKELIEKGFDEDKAMNFYKVYFKEEA